MSHSISSVDASWTTSPLTRVRSVFPRKSQSVTRPGPTGARLSEPFTRSIEPASVSRKSCSP